MSGRETWRPIPGWDGYEVSDLGNVRSWRTFQRGVTATSPRLLKAHLNPKGYLAITLSGAEGAATRRVHRLVLLAFVGEPPPGFIGCHNDGDRRNNTLGNLRWDTYQANAQDTLRHGRHPAQSITHCPSGHAYSEANTRLTKEGYRICRACAMAYLRAYSSRRACCPNCGKEILRTNLSRHLREVHGGVTA